MDLLSFCILTQLNILGGLSEANLENVLSVKFFFEQLLNIHACIIICSIVNEFTINISPDKTLFKFIQPLELCLQVFFLNKIYGNTLKEIFIFFSNMKCLFFFNFFLLKYEVVQILFSVGLRYVFFIYENVSSVSFSHSDKNSSHKTIYLFLFVFLSRQTSFFF